MEIGLFKLSISTVVNFIELHFIENYPLFHFEFQTHLHWIIEISHTHVYVCVCVYMYIYKRACVHVCIYILKVISHLLLLSLCICICSYLFKVRLANGLFILLDIFKNHHCYFYSFSDFYLMNLCFYPYSFPFCVSFVYFCVLFQTFKFFKLLNNII